MMAELLNSLWQQNVVIEVLLQCEAQPGIQVDVPRLVLEVVLDVVAVVEVVAGGRLDIDAQ